MDNIAVRISNILSSTQIDNIENIAKNTSGSSRDEYIKNFAENIVDAKLKSSGILYEIDEDLRLIKYANEKILVIVAPEKIIQKNGKENLTRHGHKIKRTLEENSLSGVIYFMPFLMNDVTARTILKRELPIGFVNLPYDSNSLERRINMYVK